MLFRSVVSLDGVTADPGSWAIFDPGAAGEAVQALHALGGMLMGRGTYEYFADVMPEQTGPYADAINAMRKYVFSSTLQNADWNNSTLIRGRLRALPAPVIWGAVWGVIQAVSPLGFWWLEPKTVYALGLAGHGLKDLWQHRTHFVRNTRWWPPFCATVDWVAAGILTTAILMGFPSMARGYRRRSRMARSSAAEAPIIASSPATHHEPIV